MDDHWYGLPAPAEATQAWGARAIYTPNEKPWLTFLWDRQSYKGATIPKKLFKSLVAELRREVKKAQVGLEEDRLCSGGSFRHPWHILFNPRASHGYMYCLIWRT